MSTVTPVSVTISTKTLNKVNALLPKKKKSAIFQQALEMYLEKLTSEKKAGNLDELIENKAFDKGSLSFDWKKELVKYKSDFIGNK